MADRLDPPASASVIWTFSYTCVCGQRVTSDGPPHSHSMTSVRACNGVDYDPNDPNVTAAMAAPGPLMDPSTLRLLR